MFIGDIQSHLHCLKLGFSSYLVPRTFKEARLDLLYLCVVSLLVSKTGRLEGVTNTQPSMVI